MNKENKSDVSIIKPTIQKNFLKFGFLFKGILGYLAYMVIFPTWLSAFIHKLRGVRIDKVKTVYIAPNVLIDNSFPEKVTIGNHVYLTRGCKIIAHTAFTPMVQEFTKCEYVVGSVQIKDGAYVGVNSVILPNVTVGKCVIVGANSTVTKDVPDYSIVVGSPAKIVGDTRDYANKIGMKHA